MTTVCFSYDAGKLKDIIIDWYIIKCYSNTVKDFEDKGKGNYCYGNKYWKDCEILETIYKDLTYILTEKFDFNQKIIKFCNHDLWNFEYIGNIILYSNENVDDLQAVKEVLICATYSEGLLHLELEAIFVYIDMYFDLWKNKFKCYETLTVANAKATIIRALYNPKTMIGKIHCNSLYDENFT